MEDFIANFMEVFGAAYFQNFSDDLFDNQLYTLPFLLIVFLPLAVGIIYYKVTDSVVRATAWSHFLHGVLAAGLATLITLGFLATKANDYRLDLQAGDMTAFLLIVFGYALVLYYLYSLVLRFISTHRRYVPF